MPKHTRKRLLKKLFDVFFANALLKRAHKIIAESVRGQQEYLEEYDFLSPEDVSILSPPFDVSEFRDLQQLDQNYDIRKKLKISPDTFIITFLGRIHEIKGVDILIKFFAELCVEYSNINLIIIGPDDGHLNFCSELAENLKIHDRVFFPGFLTGDEKNQALKTSNCVVQLSRHEAGAWAPMEGLLCGTPIIVSEHTGAGEDIKRLGFGQTVSIDNSNDFRAAINNIMQNQRTHFDLAMNARDAIINKLSFDARINEYFKLYGLD